MAWFKGYPGLVGIVNAVVAAPPAPPEAPERETYQPAPYVPPPVKPPRKSGISRGLLYAGIGATILGLAAAVAVFGSRVATQQPQPTPTVTAIPQPTPTIDAAYYQPQPTPPTPTRIPTLTPTAIARPTPTPRPVPTSTPYITPTAPVYVFPIAEPTETPEPTATPTPKPTPTPNLEERIKEAKAVIEKYRNDYTTIITDYATIKPIVDAIFESIGLRMYDDIRVTILPRNEFNKQYCELFGPNWPACVEHLEKGKAYYGFVKGGGTDVVVRRAPFYEALFSVLREVPLGLGQLNDAKPTNLQTSEIYGNIGFSFANITLAEKLGYEPNNDLADTPENRAKLNSFKFSDGFAPRWLRASWLIAEDAGFLDRNKPEKMMTAAQAQEVYKRFINNPNPDDYVEKLLASHDILKDAEWVRGVLLFRINPNKKTPTDLDTVIFDNHVSYLPIGSPNR